MNTALQALCPAAPGVVITRGARAMVQNPRMFRLAAWPAWLLIAAPSVWANNCDALRSAIETKIRANGVAQPQISVVPMDTDAPGRVVGSCAKGTMKILYSAGPNSAPNTAPHTAPKAPPVVITECADGRVITSGSCKQR
jgi:hypothetical protein